MKQHGWWKFAVGLLMAYLLTACGAASAVPNGQSPAGASREVVFGGTVEAIGSGSWTVSGQVIAVTGDTAVDAGLQVGDNVKVEARVEVDGAVTATRIEGTAAEAEANANSNTAEDPGSNTNGNEAGSNSNLNGNDNANGNVNINGNQNANDNSAPAGPEKEVSGILEAIGSDSLTIDGVTYQTGSFTEFKDLVAVGDSVKAHVITAADGALFVREIEKVETLGANDNTNLNGSDDNANLNSNEAAQNGNGDDHGNNNGSDDSNKNENESENENSNGSGHNG